MTDTAEHKPEPHVVWIDETQHLSDSARDACGRLFTGYVYDATEATHCCELTPSYWLEAVSFETQNELPDALYEELQYSLYDSAHYRHCSGVARLDPQPLCGDFDDMEEAREYVQGNPPGCPHLALTTEDES